MSLSQCDDVKSHCEKQAYCSSSLTMNKDLSWKLSMPTHFPNTWQTWQHTPKGRLPNRTVVLTNCTCLVTYNCIVSLKFIGACLHEGDVNTCCSSSYKLSHVGTSIEEPDPPHCLWLTSPAVWPLKPCSLTSTANCWTHWQVSILCENVLRHIVITFALPQSVWFPQAFV